MLTTRLLGAERGADLVRVLVSLLYPSYGSGCVVACMCVPFDGERSRSDLVRLELANLKTKSLRPSPSIHNQNKMAINPGEVLLRTNPPTEKTNQTEAAVNFDKPARIDSILHSAGKVFRTF
uniref:Uncharacterized protein n=1 Tax=Timema shepardi TaxID=629360 RepID=A0A7R9AZG4_TIMSH|nr:unnamed protein product [Timema shepardi]